MLTDEVKATIRYALLDMREAYHLSGYSKIDMDALDIALAALDEQPRRWQLLPDDVGDAIAGLIGFACNPDHMNRDSLVMAYTASKWFDAKDALNEEVK